MKILYHHRIASKDGQFVHIEEILHSLRKQGHTVRVVSPSGSENQEFGGEGGFVSDLKARLPQWLYELMEFAYSFVAFIKLLYQALLFKPQFIYERFNLFLPAGIWVSKLLGIPLFLEVNSPLYEERERFDGLAMKKLARWSQAYVLRNAAKVLPVTHVLADNLNNFLKEQGDGMDLGKVQVIPNGINTDAFLSNIAPARLPDSFRDCTVIGFVGFCREWHGLEKVVTMLSGLDDSKVGLLIVGDGPAIPGLIQQAQSLGLQERVHFTGIVSRKEMPAWVEAIDIALQPAVVSYASPLKLLEYMAKGKAIVAPDQPNIAELVRHGETALLFTPENQDDFCKAVKLLCEERALREKIGQAARQEVIERPLTWDNNARNIVELYRSVV